ncbi:hypothetical protein A4A49_55152 [Nicotiana attenuata]|uniref:G-patch domain-containing protein n=1 Tax=Nicotiana attenuata TaxID=49451 RepID=A0A1J6J1S3_NICAT|nr:hypothetical protein A4A49_55152 [Nicotiana attenuata]
MLTTEIEETKQNLAMQSPYRSNMAMREIMKYGYRPRIGLGARSNGITEPVQPRGQKDRANIRYYPRTGKNYTGGFDKKDFVPEHVTGRGHSSATQDDIVDGMGKLFMTMIEE